MRRPCAAAVLELLMFREVMTAKCRDREHGYVLYCCFFYSSGMYGILYINIDQLCMLASKI